MAPVHVEGVKNESLSCSEHVNGTQDVPDLRRDFTLQIMQNTYSLFRWTFFVNDLGWMNSSLFSERVLKKKNSAETEQIFTIYLITRWKINVFIEKKRGVDGFINASKFERAEICSGAEW